VAEQSLSKQEENFRTLVSRDALNMQSSLYRTLIFPPGENDELVEQAVSAFYQEVGCK